MRGRFYYAVKKKKENFHAAGRAENITLGGKRRRVGGNRQTCAIVWDEEVMAGYSYPFCARRRGEGKGKRRKTHFLLFPLAERGNRGVCTVRLLGDSCLFRDARMRTAA